MNDLQDLLQKLNIPQQFATDCHLHGTAVECYANGKCIKCQEEKQVGKRQVEIATLKTALIKSSGIPPLFENSTFESYTAPTIVQQQSIKLLVQNSIDKNVIMLGKTGTGKSHFGCSIIQKEIDKELQSLSEDDINEYKSRLNRQKLISKFLYVKFSQLTQLKFENPSLFKRLLTSKFIIIDEIGRQSSDGREEVLFEIMDHRYDHILTSCLISNLTANDLRDYIGHALFSRLKENYILIDAQWVDYRRRNDV